MGLALKGLNISLIGKRHSTSKNEIAVEKWICCSTMESSSLRNRTVIAIAAKQLQNTQPATRGVLEKNMLLKILQILH